MTIRQSINPTITLYSGNNFDFTNPEECNFTIEDIAHALSNLCRFTGHCRAFYSVAEHSVLVSQMVAPEQAYNALLHDAAEAFVHDVARPLKALLPDYKVIEKRIESVVFERLGVSYPLPDEIDIADRRMLLTEIKLLMPPGHTSWDIFPGCTPFELPALPCWSPRDAKDAFMERYAELIREMRRDFL